MYWYRQYWPCSIAQRDQLDPAQLQVCRSVISDVIIGSLSTPEPLAGLLQCFAKVSHSLFLYTLHWNKKNSCSDLLRYVQMYTESVDYAKEFEVSISYESLYSSTVFAYSYLFLWIIVWLLILHKLKFTLLIFYGKNIQQTHYFKMFAPLIM